MLYNIIRYYSMQGMLNIWGRFAEAMDIKYIVKKCMTIRIGCIVNTITNLYSFVVLVQI